MQIKAMANVMGKRSGEHLSINVSPIFIPTRKKNGDEVTNEKTKNINVHQLDGVPSMHLSRFHRANSLQKGPVDAPF